MKNRILAVALAQAESRLDERRITYNIVNLINVVRAGGGFQEYVEQYEPQVGDHDWSEEAA